VRKRKEFVKFGKRCEQYREIKFPLMATI
jgi:hypothetical protein